MEALKFSILLVALVVCMKFCSGSASDTKSPISNTFEAHNQFIKDCCNNTIYQTLCVNSLSSYSTKIKSRYPKLVYTAINLSLVTAKSALSALLKLSQQSDLQPNEVAALTDCVGIVRDTVDELQMSMEEFQNLNATDLEYKVSKILTWESTALSNYATCLEGCEEQTVDSTTQDPIREIVTNCLEMTSNALALVNVNQDDYTQLYQLGVYLEDKCEKYLDIC